MKDVPRYKPVQPTPEEEQAVDRLLETFSSKSSGDDDVSVSGEDTVKTA